MTGLQEAYYIIGIIYMVVMLALVVALLISVFIIRNKVNTIHDKIDAKINTVTSLAEKGGEIAGLATGVFARKAKKAIRKK
jgi:low affinity Fe/Cu permease